MNNRPPKLELKFHLESIESEAELIEKETARWQARLLKVARSHKI